jgi:7-cyano-7-deazaguanine synthase
MNQIFDGYFGGATIVVAPFTDFTKFDIIDFCRHRNVPIELTFSCERAANQPCGHCSSCLDRMALIERT